ncbi:MAG: 2-succinyl-5-enolpyruvyl-6-hydroxy-3-cyclohexene-1-carboxylic-acid synthase [Chitinophagaceae bacterium]
MNRFQYHINSVVAALYSNGLRHAVLCPGSRNAPIIMAFARFGKITCHSAVDERAAGFIALGIAKQTQNPVAVVCTSGSALANIYPAVLEAFYMQVPLLVISADRPAEMIDRWDGQTIHQFNIFGQHVKGSFTTPDSTVEDVSDDFISAANDTFRAATGKLKGPAHLNMPLAEPLYEAVNETFIYPELSHPISSGKTSSQIPEALISALNTSSKVMMLFGADYSDADCQTIKEHKHMVVLADLISNRRHLQSVSNWEAILLQSENTDVLMPEVLITFGKMVLNKTMKQLLRLQNIQHWHIDESAYCADTYFSSPKLVEMKQADFLNWLNQQSFSVNSSFLQIWKSASDKQFSSFQYTEWSFGELTAINELLKQISDKAVLHVSNSMSVRNAAYMASSLSPEVKVHCNRGVSGIDGCTSAAIGMAMSDPEHRHILISGDIAFLYDINAFLIQKLPANLTIVVMNNGGGGIFKILDGPAGMPELNPYVFTPQKYNLSDLAKTYGLNYYKAINTEEVKSSISVAFSNASCSLIEIETDADKNSKQFKQYKSNKI